MALKKLLQPDKAKNKNMKAYEEFLNGPRFKWYLDDSDEFA